MCQRTLSTAKRSISSSSDRLMSSVAAHTEGDDIHSVELCVYSILSTDLDAIYQSINQLRESQALLVLLLRKCRNSLKTEHEVLYDKSGMESSGTKLKELERRLTKISKRVNDIKLRSEKMVTQE